MEQSLITYRHFRLLVLSFSRTNLLVKMHLYNAVSQHRKTLIVSNTLGYYERIRGILLYFSLIVTQLFHIKLCLHAKRVFQILKENKITYRCTIWFKCLCKTKFCCNCFLFSNHKKVNHCLDIPLTRSVQFL